MPEQDLPGLPRVIAHRGASGEAPENTLEAVRLAAEQGARWVEVDVMVTADGTPVLHHDNYLDRCTNGSGYLLARQYEEIQGLDAGSWFNPRYAGARIPTLEALLTQVEALDLGLNIEIKPVSGWEEPTAVGVCETLARVWRHATPLLLSSFSQESLRVARKLLPGLPRGLVTSVVPPDWHNRLAVAGCVSLHCHHYPLLTRQRAEEIKAEGRGLLCFTVNSPEDGERLMDWGVDAVFSDYPGRLIERIGV